LRQPRMFVVAGPPGSGKSTLFPVSRFHVDFFNADDRAAALNHGSYLGISAQTRRAVNAEFEQWVNGHISSRRSFALETTLRSTVTFGQARQAQEAGFHTILYFISAGSIQECLRRILRRSYRGGHSASERLVTQIYEKSMRNLSTALIPSESGFERVRILDNSRFGGFAVEVAALLSGKLIRRAHPLPPWLKGTLATGERPIGGVT